MRYGFDTSYLVAFELDSDPDHMATREQITHLRRLEARFAVAAQVFSELIHVVTDPRRFERAPSIEEALARTRIWWQTPDVELIAPNDHAVERFFDQMQKGRLGESASWIPCSLPPTGPQVWMESSPSTQATSGISKD